MSDVNLQVILNLVSTLGKVIKDLVLGFLFYFKGKDDVNLETLERELDNAKISDKLDNHIASLPSSVIADSLLSDDSK